MTCPLCHNLRYTSLGHKDQYEIVQCLDCGIRYVRNMPTEAELAAYYAAYHGNLKNVRNAARKVRRWRRRLWLLRRLARGPAFLEIGCNTGFAVEAARQLGFQATGFDLSTEAISYARATFAGCLFQHGTAETTAASGKRYDTVLCSEVIEHLTTLDGFAKALGDLVASGGLLYLTTPDTEHFLTPRNLLGWKEVCPPHHLIYFNRAQIRRFLEAAGFRLLFFYPVLHKASIRVIARRVE
jgi:2-polyprenyl-3-methyl-5-hydroxy-6-metoxy-1,4-benzoquinol methylase